MKPWFAWLAFAVLLAGIPLAVPAQDSSTAPAADETPAEETSPAATPTPAPLAAPQGGERIEATVEQLEQLINAPPEARLGREIDEPDQPYSLFGDKSRVTELLGDNPRYVYIPSGTDPMIVPWVRNRVMAAELVSEANELTNAGKYQEALAKVDLVLERFSDSDSVEKARQLKMKLDALVRDQGEKTVKPMATPGETPTTLPSWIPQNTRGIAYDVNNPKNSTVLIGEYILRPGDTIPSFPGIKVVEIKRGVVTLDYQGEVFQLQVEGN